MSDSGDQLRKSIITGVALLAVIYIIAIPFYMYFEGFTLVEAFYFVSITITTVGYGDIVPKTTIGRLFTVALLFSGVTIFFYHITHLGQYKERTIDPHVQQRLNTLRHLVAMQTDKMDTTELKKIRSKIRDEKPRDFGRL